MTIQRLLITASALTLLAVGASAPAGARNLAGDPTKVTFLRNVQLPGQVLPAGEYVFERVNPESSTVAVLVRNTRGTVQWMGLTNVTTRREAGKSAIELSEARQGEAPRVLAWFASGAFTGASFIY